VTGAVCCSSCGERLELSFAASELVADPAAEPPVDLEFCADGYEIRFRTPNSLDLVAASNERDMNRARARLLVRCISIARRDGSEIEPDGLPESIVDAIAARMAEADPQADIYLAFTCPACGNRWRSQFDVEAFFWAEINAWAARMLNEVHVLASRYRWSESEILEMSARRRQCYLNLISG
jgi:hypothetical protein